MSNFRIVPFRAYIAIGLLALLLAPFSAFAQSSLLFVANVYSDTVSVISASTNAVVSTIPVGAEPRNLAVTPNGARVYVPNRDGNTVTVISTTTQTAIATVSDASFDEPYSAAVTPNGAEVWVVNKQGGGSSTGSITIVSTATNTVVGTINDTCFSSPEWISINPVQARAYVINRGNGTVCIVDTGTRTVLAPIITVGGEPRSAVMLPDGSAVFVARTDVSMVTGVARIDTATNAVTPIAVTGSPRNMAITPSGSKIYVPTQGNALAVIDTATNAVSSVTTSASRLYGAAVAQTPLGLRAYVTDEFSDKVFVVDTGTDTVLSGAGFPIAGLGTGSRAIAAASVAAPTLAAAPIPTMGHWALLLMTLLIVGTAFSAQHRRKR